MGDSDRIATVAFAFCGVGLFVGMFLIGFSFAIIKPLEYGIRVDYTS